MSVARRFFRVTVSCLFVLQILGAQNLTTAVQQKLHPYFQSILSGGTHGSGGISSAGLSKEGEPLYEASISMENASAVRALGVHLNSVFGTVGTARLTRAQLLALAGSIDVRYIEPGSENRPALDVSIPEIGANLLHSGFLNNTSYKGKGVIVVIFDTGIDWRHLDFRDPTDTTKSRILSIWDQTITPGSGESSPTGMTYGVEYTKQHIENEIDGSPASFVRERDINGHGTHVAGIVAGNGKASGRYVGVAPEADIIVIKGGDETFSSTRMIDGLTYAQNKAIALGKPVVVNWSIGGQSGPHDGTRDYEVAVDVFVQTAGRIVVISAGNEGDKIIHTSGTVDAENLGTVSITVPAYTQTAGTLNDKFTLEIWLSTDIGITATAKSPNGVTVSAGVNSTTSAAIESDGSIDLYNYRGSNGKRYVQLAVQDRDTTKIPRAGTWTVTLSGATAGAAYDAWLTSTRVGSLDATILNGNTQKTVSSPGTSKEAITVASYVSKNGWPSVNGSGYVYTSNPAMLSISAFSSRGPTGDGRQKPDLAAPGHGIASALSVASNQFITIILPGGKHMLIQGTSQAAPHVAGAIALLLQISKNLSAAQVKDLLTSTAVVDSYTGTIPNYSWGYGKLDILKAAAKLINPQAPIQRQILSSDAEGSSSVYAQPLTGSAKLAYRFTPTFAGQVTGFYVNLSSAVNRSVAGSGSIVCEVWSNVAGLPGSKLGNSVLLQFQNLVVSTNNFVDMTTAGVNVAPGQDYHAIIFTSNAQDSLRLRTENSTSLVNRYSWYSGGSWSAVTTGANPRLRAVVTSLSGLVSVGPDHSIPRDFTLSQNYPNPFNPTTNIEYTVPSSSRVRVKVFDLIGREVITLVDEELIAGKYRVKWNGVDQSGQPLSSGIYFCRMEGGGFSLTRKMLLMK